MKPETTERRAQRASKAIAHARRMVDSLRTARAQELLEILSRSDLPQSNQFEVEALRVESWILEGRFEEAHRAIPDLRGLTVNEHQKQEVALLDAYRLARGARTRLAFRSAAKVIRDVERRGDQAAKGYWIAGLALFRAGHYRWAKACLELGAAHLSTDTTTRQAGPCSREPLPRSQERRKNERRIGALG